MDISLTVFFVISGLISLIITLEIILTIQSRRRKYFSLYNDWLQNVKSGQIEIEKKLFRLIAIMVDGPDDIEERIKSEVCAYQKTVKNGADTVPSKSLKCIELVIREISHFGYRGDKPSLYPQEFHSSLYLLYCWLRMYRIWIMQKIQEENLLKPENGKMALVSKIIMLEMLQAETHNALSLMQFAIDPLPLD